MNFIKVLAILMVMALYGVGMSQDRGGPPPAGPRGGTPPMPGLKGPRAGPGLLTRPAVQKELNLSEDQIAKIRELFPKPGTGTQAGLTGPEVDKKLREILTPEQFTRLIQLRLQAGGALAFVRPGIAKKLGLSADQVSKMRDIIAAAKTQVDADPQLKRRPVISLREKAEPQLLALLTPEQRKSWDDMLGRPLLGFN